MDKFDLENFEKLNRALRGKDDYYFLVNDSNAELRQHYDPYYINKHYDEEKTRDTINYKKEFFKKRGCNYGCFVFADKSVVLREYLPFDTCKPIRIIDNLSDCLYDLREVIEKEDFSHGDTHCSMRASIRIVSYILEKLLNGDLEISINDLQRSTDFSLTDIIQYKIKEMLFSSNYEDILKGMLDIKIEPHHDDLLDELNYSYPEDHLTFQDTFEDLTALYTKKDYIDKKDDIPEQFSIVGNRESEYYYNENSLTDKKALILHDSSAISLKPALISVYREIFFYWDHWNFNKELVEWFNPDDCIEIRIERMIIGTKYL